MAACKEVSDMESLQHLMTCGICLDTLKKPVLFPCIHHFCKQCKSQLKEEVQDGIAGVLCPTCRRFTGHDSIKEDFVMEQIVDLHTSKDTSGELAVNDCCELCLKDKSVVKCMQCKMKLCDSCRTLHLRMPFSRGHTLKELNQVKDDKVLDSVVLCSEHPDKIIEFSCVKCEKAICYMCKILYHDGHKTETVENAIQRLMSNVHKKMEPVASEIESLKQKMKDLADTDQLTSSWENNTISEINSHKLGLISRIEKDSEGLIEEVRAKAAAKRKEIYMQKTDAEHLLSSKESTRSWINTMVSHLGDVNLLLQLQGDIMATINKQQVATDHADAGILICAPEDKFNRYQIAFKGNLVGSLQKQDRNSEYVKGINPRRHTHLLSKTNVVSDHPVDESLVITPRSFSRPVTIDNPSPFLTNYPPLHNSEYVKMSTSPYTEGSIQESYEVEVKEEDDDCCICMCPITNPKTLKCSHTFCTECIDRIRQIKPICPICGEIFGVMIGNQPPGIKTVSKSISRLPGYPDCGTIVIHYDIPGGTLMDEYQNPGVRYSGVRRTGYLPDNKEGRKVSRLLGKAYDYRLIFTVGRSVTSGADYTVIWNDIHHKTNTHGGAQGFGYPDPDYLKRVQEELAAKGIK